AGFQCKEYYDEYPEEKEIILIKIGKSPRDILIEVGNYLRKVYSRIWIDYLLMAQDELAVYIITDVRYYNEVQAIKLLGGSIYRIDRDTKKFDDMADSALEDFNEWDGIIDNNKEL